MKKPIFDQDDRINIKARTLRGDSCNLKLNFLKLLREMGKQPIIKFWLLVYIIGIVISFFI